MIANNEKKPQIEIIKNSATLITTVQKALLHDLYFLAKTSLLFFQDSTGQVKIELSRNY